MNSNCKAKLSASLIATKESCSSGLRQLSEFFDCCPDHLTIEQLKTYFLDLATNRSWSAVKINSNAIQFFYKHVLESPWQWVKPPKEPLNKLFLFGSGLVVFIAKAFVIQKINAY